VSPADRTSLLTLRYFIAGRLVLGLAVAFLQVPMGAGAGAAVLIAVLLVLTSMMGVKLLSRGPVTALSLTVLLLTDFLLVTYVVLRTGAQGSPFVLLYGFTVMCAGLLLAFAGGVTFGSLAAVASLGLIWLVPAPPEGVHLSSGVARLPATRLVLQAVFFVALGGASGALVSISRRRDRQWAETSSRLEQTELEAETILGHLPWGVLTLDVRGRVRDANPAACEILGTGGPLTAEDLSSTDLRSLVGDALTGMVERILGGTDRVTGEVDVQRPDGATRPLQATALTLRGPASEPRGVVLLFQDLTERRKLEAKARRQDRLAALGRFSAGLAHEIRNSLKPISGSAELLTSMTLPSEAEPLRDLILREAEALEEFLESYLDLVRDKDLQIEPVDIDALIREELETLGHRSGERGGPASRVVGPPGGMSRAVSGDREQLRRALRNLLLNALEATPKGTVKIRVEERGAASVRIRIRDWGCGMNQETLENLFTPLYTTKARGTGLGLCYARKVVERHGGTLKIKSRSGIGTLVTLDLPRRESRAAAA